MTRSEAIRELTSVATHLTPHGSVKLDAAGHLGPTLLLNGGPVAIVNASNAIVVLRGPYAWQDAESFPRPGSAALVASTILMRFAVKRVA